LPRFLEPLEHTPDEFWSSVAWIDTAFPFEKAYYSNVEIPELSV
jgi:hypothetical protein